MAQYREGLLNLEQLTAFAITDDHARQEAVWRDLSWNKSGEMIRRALTQYHVLATDRRAVFVGIDTYEAVGGFVLRDLFSEDDRGVYLEDVALLDRLVVEKLRQEAEAVRAEGWKWIEVYPEFAYGMAAGMRRIYPQAPVLTDEQQARLDTLEREFEELSIRHDGGDEGPEVDTEFERLETEIAAVRGHEAYDPEALAQAGGFVCLGHDGKVRIERGFIRPEDEPQPEPVEGAPEGEALQSEDGSAGDAADIGAETGATTAETDPEESDELTPLSERLIEELTTHRTAGLQAVMMDRPDIALMSVVHALALRTFYGAGYNPSTCLKIEVSPVEFVGIVGNGPAMRQIATRHEEWARILPKGSGALWDWMVGQEADTLLRLLAYCASRTVYAVKAQWNGDPKRLAHADALAAEVGLDMAEYWIPTVETYLGRVTKARILEAVREGVSERDAEAIAGLKKPEMASHAERLLSGRRWLPVVMRTEGVPLPPEIAANVSSENVEADANAAE